jgi:radical SAM superfamily enzyme YgiQ (UPF0313 family)
MRFERVLLITLPVRTHLEPLRPSLGLGYLAQVLLENNIEYDVLDMLLGYSLNDLKNKIVNFKPDLIGISMFSNKYKIAYGYIDKIKRFFPEIKIVVGGPHASCFREKLLQECVAIDYGIILEGEEALLELCRGENLSQIENLIYRQNGEVIMNPLRNFVKDLDRIPFPTYQKFELKRYVEEKSIISSRGCPYECTFCAVKVVNGKEIRARSPSNVVGEIDYWYRRGYRWFSFQDDNFIFYKDNVYRICDEIEKKKFKDVFFRGSGIRADKTDRDLLIRMKNVGFKTIAMGVEVGNDKMLQIIKKGEKFEDIDRAVKLACELGFDVQLYFLSGVPYETVADIKDAVNFALKYPIFYAEWSNTIPYPGTELYDWLEHKKYMLAEPEEYLNYNATGFYSVTANSYVPIFQTPGLSLDERKKIMFLLQKTRREILRRGINRKLAQMGLPWGLRDLVAYIISLYPVSKFLHRVKFRNLVDKFRFNFSFYNKRQKEKIKI